MDFGKIINASMGHIIAGFIVIFAFLFISLGNGDLFTFLGPLAGIVISIHLGYNGVRKFKLETSEVAAAGCLVGFAMWAGVLFSSIFYGLIAIIIGVIFSLIGAFIAKHTK